MPDHMDTDFDVLASSREFAEFSRIIRSLTGLAMAINAPGVTRIHTQLKINEQNPLCKIIQSVPEGNARCRACDRRHHGRAAAAGRPLCYTCHAGFIDMAIPIIIQGSHVATISCGQILPERPTAKGAEKILRRLKWLKMPRESLIRAYYKAPYIPRPTIKYVMRLQSLFARQLCESARQLRELSAKLIRDDVRKAREYILKNFQSGQMQLADVAAQAGLSKAHFCGVFRKSTGVHYSKYVQDLRMTEAKKLLSSTEKSISEICHACGFNSLTHFNRVFRSFERKSPRYFRKTLMKGNA